MRKLILVGGALAIVVLATICFIKQQEVKATQIEVAKAQAEKSYLNHRVEMLNGKINRYVSSLNIAFNPAVSVVDKSQLEMPITDIFGAGQTLCLYFTETMCPPCVEVHIQQFKEFEKRYGVKKMRILTTTQNTQGLENINQRYITDIPFYHIDAQALPFGDIENSPVVFVVNDLLYISGVYYPETQISPNNGMYYKNVEQYLQ